MQVLLVLGAAWAGDAHVYWGAIHEHSGLTREAYGFSAEDIYRYMLDDAELDFGAATDHDWALAQGTWGDAKAAVNAFHCPSGATDCYGDVSDSGGTLPDRHFVTLLGYEWGNNAWPTHDQPNGPEYGHRNVWFLDAADPEADYAHPADTGEACELGSGCIPMVPSGEDLRADGWETWHEPCDLWEGLAELLAADPDLRAFTAAHHVALSISGQEGETQFGREKPPATDWRYHPSDCEGVPEDIEPLVELYSVWGSNERASMPAEEDPVDGLADDDRVIREIALGGSRGQRHYLGFYGSGDNHAGNPGHDPGHSFLDRPAGDFLSYKSDCNPGASCGVRFGRTGLVGAVVPATGAKEDQLTREAIYDALVSRRTIATTGERFHLSYDLVTDSVTGSMGEDLRDLDLARAVEAKLEIQVDLLDYDIARLQVLLAGSDGLWESVDVEEAEGSSTWSGEVVLVEDGRPMDWVPGGDVVLYVRVAAEAVPAIEVPADTPPVTVTESTGGTTTLSVIPGRYTGAALGEAVESALNLDADLDLTYAVTYQAESSPEFHISVAEEEAGVHFGFAEAPTLGYLMGYRDDVDTPEEGFCNPCEPAVPVAGGELRERAWASPIWVTHSGQVQPGDSGGPDSGPVDEEPPDDGCGCGSAPAAGWALLGLLAVWRRGV